MEAELPPGKAAAREQEQEQRRRQEMGEEAGKACGKGEEEAKRPVWVQFDKLLVRCRRATAVSHADLQIRRETEEQISGKEASAGTACNADVDVSESFAGVLTSPPSLAWTIGQQKIKQRDARPW